MRIALSQASSVLVKSLKLLAIVWIDILIGITIVLSINWQSTLYAETTFLLNETIASQPSNAVKSSTIVTISNRQILVNGQPFVIKGVGYAPTPIGNDPDFPPHGDYFTVDYRPIYERDLALLRQMGANTIRLWGWKYDADHTDFLDEAYNNGVNPIYVIVSLWLDPTRNILDPVVNQTIITEFTQTVAIHKDHPAVLMWAIGNELHAPWMFGDTVTRENAIFNLIDEIAQAIHEEEGVQYHPVTTPLVDIDLINTIAIRDSQVSNLDVWAVQIYRGQSFGTLFSDYAAVSNKPLVIAEYGIDAYDDQHAAEYENIGPPYQAIYAASLWNEIVANSDIAAGGSIMAYSDEWWKGRFGETDSDHLNCPDFNRFFHSDCGYDTLAHSDGYANEEWWGIMRPVDNGPNPDIMQPRAVFCTLQSLWATPCGAVYLPTILKNSG